MPRFFIDFPCSPGELVVVDGENGKHIARSLRMHPGEEIVLCDGNGSDFSGVIDHIEGNSVSCRILSTQKNPAEPSLHVTLLQCLTKGDKMELVIQKAVELGVSEIIPVLSTRCISRPDPSSMEKKLERWQKIALEAAKQSGRGMIPKLHSLLDFSKALETAAQYEPYLFFYEGGGESLHTSISPSCTRTAIMIGPEGGFESCEADAASNAGAKIVTLGPRILRTETAPLAALACVMFATGNI